MDKYIILTNSEFYDGNCKVPLGDYNVPIHAAFQQLIKIGSGDIGTQNVIAVFDKIPSQFNSKTVYTKEQVDGMLRDVNGEFYIENY